MTISLFSAFFGHKIYWKKGIKRKDKPFKPLILLGFLIYLNYIVWTYLGNYTAYKWCKHQNRFQSSRTF